MATVNCTHPVLDCSLGTSMTATPCAVCGEKVNFQLWMHAMGRFQIVAINEPVMIVARVKIQEAVELGKARLISFEED